MFTLAIVSSISLLGGVFLAGYYSDHGAPIASVNGEIMSKDAVRDRAALDVARIDRQLANYQAQRNRGDITSAEYSTLASTLQSSEDPSTIYSDALTKMIGEAEIRQYAAKNGITVTDAQVDAQIRLDATTEEMRHVKIISVEAVATPPASAKTQADIADALTKAEGYLAEIQGGKKWDDVAKEAERYSSTTSGTTGDIGLTTKDALGVEPDLADAIFALAKPNDTTLIFKSDDGAFRFATVTSIAPKSVDPNWESSISATANGDLYRSVARAEAIQKAVQNAVEAKYVYGPTVQRKVLEIAMSPGYGEAGDGDEVKVRIMVFATHDAASPGTAPTTDDQWNAAKARADDAVAKLRKDASQFDKMATDTTINDDANWGSRGGSIPWIPLDLFNAQTAGGQQGLGMPAVGAAVFKDGLAVGTILDPIQETSAGYVVVQFQGRRDAPATRMASAQFALNSGTDFSLEATQVSESTDAVLGGDLGWVSPYQLGPDQAQVIFKSTPVGRVGNMLSGSGYYVLYKVVDEQTRVADLDQQAKLKRVVFTNWLTELQGNALVWQDTAGLTAMSPATAAPAQ
jgi:parvulin-like peptidyl-prolyl isomerase